MVSTQPRRPSGADHGHHLGVAEAEPLLAAEPQPGLRDQKEKSGTAEHAERGPERAHERDRMIEGSRDGERESDQHAGEGEAVREHQVIDVDERQGAQESAKEGGDERLWARSEARRPSAKSAAIALRRPDTPADRRAAPPAAAAGNR